MLCALISHLFAPKLSTEEKILAACRTAEILPYVGFPFTAGFDIPCLRASKVLHQFYEARCPVRSTFDNVIERVETGEKTVLLSDISGCTASKTSTSFAHMASLKWFAEEAYKYRDHIDDLAEKVLNGNYDGSFDCLRYAGTNTRIFRQSWDGRMWFANEKGSHRTGAVWLLDREQNRERLIPSEIVDFRVHPAFKKFCETHSIFLFKAGNDSALLDLSVDLPKSDIILATPIGSFSSTQSSEWCLVLPKNNSRYDELCASLPSAFDFSDWALNPNAYRKYEPYFAVDQASLSFTSI